MTSNKTTHFNQKQLRDAEYIAPPNNLKNKVGSGGISVDILEKAETILTENTVDFIPMAQKFLTHLHEGIVTSKNALKDSENSKDAELLISAIVYPAMQLKANGTTFHYPLVTKISAKLVQFLEVIEDVDAKTLEVIDGFYTALKALISGRIRGEGGKSGQELYTALNQACMRFFKEKRTDPS